MAKRRKASNGNGKHTSAVMIRCTDVQRKKFEKLATAEGLSTSTWARMILVRQINGGTKHDAPGNV